MDKEWKKDILDMKRVGDRIVALKFIQEQETFNVISVSIPHVELEEHLKVKNSRI